MELLPQRGRWSGKGNGMVGGGGTAGVKKIRWRDVGGGRRAAGVEKVRGGKVGQERMENITGGVRGLHSSLEPRLSVPDFVSQLWRKFKAAKQNPEWKAWVRG